MLKWEDEVCKKYCIFSLIEKLLVLNNATTHKESKVKDNLN